MDLEPVISQDILLLSPPCKQMCVAQGPEDKLQCVYWYSEHLQRSGAFCSLFFSTSSPSPSPALLLVTGWWDETRALDSRAAEQQAEDAGRVSRECSGRGAAARGQDPGPVSGHPHAAAAAGWARAGPVRSSREQASVCLPSKTLLSPVLGSSAALRRWVSAPQLSWWWPHCVLHQPAAVADQLQLLSPFSAAAQPPPARWIPRNSEISQFSTWPPPLPQSWGVQWCYKYQEVHYNLIKPIGTSEKM